MRSERLGFIGRYGFLLFVAISRKKIGRISSSIRAKEPAKVIFWNNNLKASLF
jgi:hypothetical protein